MLRLSTKTRYGLRILVRLAEAGRQGILLNGPDLAEQEDLTEAYLEQIMIPLKTHGLVRAIRGRRGGYQLKRPPETITVLDVIALLERGADLVVCRINGRPCPRRTRCPAHPVWQRLTKALQAEAGQITLTQMMVPGDSAG